MVETVKGIPGLMKVKYLGALFRMHDTDVRESELLVFIMPEIIGYQGGLDREMHALCVTQQEAQSHIDRYARSVYTRLSRQVLPASPSAPTRAQRHAG
ncbi:MAG: hypothetical protein R3C56_37280 [Pirellulaceae bacterium]